MISVGLVAIGGFFGAMTRFMISKKLNTDSASLPIGTLSVNLLGSLLLGFLLSQDLASDLLLLIGTGFMGAFTTFSTLKSELITLMKERKRIAYLYMLISYVGGILLAFFGFWFGLFLV